MTTKDESPRREAAFFTSIRSWGIARGEHGVFGGVIEGVGDRIGLDRVPARIIAVVLLFLTGGFFLTVYATAWALFPDRSGRIIIQDFGRGTPNVGALIVIAIFAMIGMGSFPWTWAGKGDWGSFPFGFLMALIPLVFLAGVIALVVIIISRSNGKSGTPGAPAVPPAPGAYAVPPQRNAPAATPAASASTAKPAKAVKDENGASVAGTAPSAGEGDDSPSGPHAAPPSANPPPMTPRPRTPGPGSAIYLLTLSMAVFAAAAIWWLERENRLSASPIVAWLAVAVVIIGGAIILVGAVGRRIGFLGFLATTFIIGWVIGLTVVPRALDFAAEGVIITIDGTRHTIGNGHGWFDESADGIVCGPYSDPGSELSDAARYVLEPGQTSVTLSSDAAILVVPEDASLVFRSDGLTTGSLSWGSRNTSCQLTRAEGTLFSSYRTGDAVTVTVTDPRVTIAIEEN